MEVAAFTVLGLALLASVMYELHERRAERLERLNRESWEVLQTARRIHDEMAGALEAMFDEARGKVRVSPPPREVDRR